MLKILLTPKANEDLELIFEYTVNTLSFHQAENYQNDLNRGFNLIALYPEIDEQYLYKSGN